MERSKVAVGRVPVIFRSPSDNLSAAMREVENALAELRVTPDPLALHSFQARRHDRELSDTKSGQRHARAARLRWQDARERGYRGTLAEWTRLLRDSVPS